MFYKLSPLIILVICTTSSCVTQKHVLNEKRNAKYTNKVISSICSKESKFPLRLNSAYFDPNIILTDTIIGIKRPIDFAYHYTPEESTILNKHYGKVEVNSCLTDSIVISKQTITNLNKGDVIVRFSPLLKAEESNTYKFLLKYYAYDTTIDNLNLISYVILERYYKINVLGKIEFIGDEKT